MLCGLGFLSAMIVSFLDVYGVKQLGDTENLKIESKKVVSTVTFCKWPLSPVLCKIETGSVQDHWSKFKKKSHRNVPHDALLHNCTNGFALRNKRTARASLTGITALWSLSNTHLS